MAVVEEASRQLEALVAAVRLDLRAGLSPMDSDVDKSVEHISGHGEVSEGGVRGLLRTPLRAALPPSRLPSSRPTSLPPVRDVVREWEFGKWQITVWYEARATCACSGTFRQPASESGTLSSASAAPAAHLREIPRAPRRC